jgi:hypothetical protein
LEHSQIPQLQSTKFQSINASKQQESTDVFLAAASHATKQGSGIQI